MAANDQRLEELVSITTDIAATVSGIVAHI